MIFIRLISWWAYRNRFRMRRKIKRIMWGWNRIDLLITLKLRIAFRLGKIGVRAIGGNHDKFFILLFTHICVINIIVQIF